MVAREIIPLTLRPRNDVNDCNSVNYNASSPSTRVISRSYANNKQKETRFAVAGDPPFSFLPRCRASYSTDGIGTANESNRNITRFAIPVAAGSERHIMTASMAPSSTRTWRTMTGGLRDHRSRYADAVGAWSEPGEILSFKDMSLFPALTHSGGLASHFVSEAPPPTRHQARFLTKQSEKSGFLSPYATSLLDLFKATTSATSPLKGPWCSGLGLAASKKKLDLTQSRSPYALSKSAAFRDHHRAPQAQDALAAVASQIRKGRVEAKKPLSKEIKKVLARSKGYGDTDSCIDSVRVEGFSGERRFLWKWAIMSIIQKRKETESLTCIIHNSSNIDVDLSPTMKQHQSSLMTLGKNSESALKRDKLARRKIDHLQYRLQKPVSERNLSDVYALDKLLASIPEIGRMDKDSRIRLQEVIAFETLPLSTALFYAGSYPSTLYILLSGTCAIIHLNDNTKTVPLLEASKKAMPPDLQIQNDQRNTQEFARGKMLTSLFRAGNANPPLILPTFPLSLEYLKKPISRRRSSARCLSLCEVLRITRPEYLGALEEGEKGIEKTVRVLGSLEELANVDRWDIVQFAKRGLMRPVREDNLVCDWPCKNGSGYLLLAGSARILYERRFEESSSKFSDHVPKGACFPITIKPSAEHLSSTHTKISLVAGPGGCLVFSFTNRTQDDTKKSNALLSRLYLAK